MSEEMNVVTVDTAQSTKKSAMSLTTLAFVTIIVAQVIVGVYLFYGMTNPPEEPRPNINDFVRIEERVDNRSKAVDKLVLIHNGEVYRFENVTVRRGMGGYWVYGDDDESVFIPYHCIYLENPKEETLRQFVKGEDHVREQSGSGRTDDLREDGANRPTQSSVQ